MVPEAQLRDEGAGLVPASTGWFTGSTALVVPVPEAEPIVGRHRRRHTPSGADGMPAHVTLLAPFTPESMLTVERVNEVRDALEQFAAFSFVLERLDRFDDETLYLVPEPGAPFVAMTRALTSRFPEHPYPPTSSGEVIPHLTVAQSDDPGVLDAIERELEDALPLRAQATEVLLMQRDTDRRWVTRSKIDLAGRGARSGP